MSDDGRSAARPPASLPDEGLTTLIKFVALAICVALLVPAIAHADGDATAGELVFKSQCSICHAVDGHNRVGPHLDGVVGRKAGSVAGYSYSAANKSSDLTWTEEVLMTYLDNPRKVVPGTKMTYVGLHDPTKRSDVIAYLKQLSKQVQP